MLFPERIPVVASVDASVVASEVTLDVARARELARAGVLARSVYTTPSCP